MQEDYPARPVQEVATGASGIIFSPGFFPLDLVCNGVAYFGTNAVIFADSSSTSQSVRELTSPHHHHREEKKGPSSSADTSEIRTHSTTSSAHGKSTFSRPVPAGDGTFWAPPKAPGGAHILTGLLRGASENKSCKNVMKFTYYYHVHLCLPYLLLKRTTRRVVASVAKVREQFAPRSSSEPAAGEGGWTFYRADWQGGAKKVGTGNDRRTVGKFLLIFNPR